MAARMNYVLWVRDAWLSMVQTNLSGARAALLGRMANTDNYL